MEEHELTHAERQLLLGFLRDPEAAEAEAGEDNWLVEAEGEAEQQLDELDEEEWDFDIENPIEDENPNRTVESVDQVGDSNPERQQLEEMEEMVAMPTLWKMGPSTFRHSPKPGIVVPDILLQQALTTEVQTQSIAGRPKRLIASLDSGGFPPQAIGCFPGMGKTLHRFMFFMSSETLQAKYPGYEQLDPQHCLIVRTRRTNLHFDTAIEVIRSNGDFVFVQEKDHIHILEYKESDEPDDITDITWLQKRSTPKIISIVAKQFETDEVGIISPKSVQILSFQDGWKGKLDIKDAMCADWLSSRSMLVGSKDRLFLGDYRQSEHRILWKSETDDITQISMCPWNPTHVALTTCPYHKVRIFDVRLMSKPLDEHMLPEEGIGEGSRARKTMNANRFFEVDWCHGSSQWMYASCLGGYDVVARSWLVGSHDIGASEYSLADDTSECKSFKDISRGCISIYLEDDKRKGLALVRNMNHQGPTVTWLEPPQALSTRPFVRRKETGSVDRQTIMSFIECILEKFVQIGFIDLAFGKEAILQHLFERREDSTTLLGHFCWLWDALQEMSIWNNIEPDELTIAVVLFADSGRVFLTALDDKAVEVPAHVGKCLDTLDACVDELLRISDDASQVVIYLKELPQASGSRKSAAFPSAPAAFALMSRQEVESHFHMHEEAPQEQEADIDVERLEEMDDAQDERLLAGLRWLEVEDAAVIQILLKCGLVKGNFGSFDMKYEEDHESNDLQLFDIVHRAKKRCVEDHRKAHLRDFFHQKRLRKRRYLRKEATKVLILRTQSHQINGPISDEDEEAIVNALRSAEPLPLASWPVGKRLHGMMLAMNLTSLPPGITPVDFRSLSKIDTVSVRELVQLAKEHETHHPDDPRLARIGVQLLVRALDRIGLLACSTTAPQEFHMRLTTPMTLQTFSLNHTLFQQPARERDPLALCIHAQRLLQRWGKDSLHSQTKQTDLGTDGDLEQMEQIHDMTMDIFEFLMASPQLAWHESLALELPLNARRLQRSKRLASEEEQENDETIQESWKNLVRLLQLSDLSKVYEFLSKEYLMRFGSVAGRKIVAHANYTQLELARLFRVVFRLASDNLHSPHNLTVSNRPRPKLPLLKFEGLHTSMRSTHVDLQKQMDDWDAKVGRTLKSEAEQKQRRGREHNI